MKLVLVILFVVYASTEEDVTDIPDCFVVKLESYAECFTFSYHVYAPHYTAVTNCEAVNGKLALITHEHTWKELINKFLTTQTNHVWMGYQVDSASFTLVPPLDLTNMSNHWTYGTLTSSSQYGQCIYGHNSDRNWYPTACSSAYDYFCQFNVTKCKISDIDFPNLNIKSCYTTDVVSNGTMVEIECSPGYYLTTANHITCINGVWETAQCIIGCPPPGERDHARLTLVKSQYSVGEEIHYICNDGYFSWKNHDVTHFSLTCMQDSTWTDADAHCSVEHKFSTIVLNVSEITEDTINLDCDLRSNNKSWIRNGYSVRNSSAFKMIQSGSLLVRSTAANIDGVYLCIGRVSGQLRIGKQAYQLVGRNECTIFAESSSSEITRLEGENVMLFCPQSHEDYHVTWYKDEQEISSNEHRNIIPGAGLFISYVELADEGVYKCQTTLNVQTKNCKLNVTHNLFVTASVKSVCGISRKGAGQHYQPWLAVLRQEDEIIPFCYGTLLNEKWVVTSAFCLLRLRLKKKIVGVYLQLGPEGRQVKIPIRVIKVHPMYRSRRNANDIGLVRLHESPIKFTNDILPLCISPIDIGNVHKCEHISDINGTVAGWGPLVDDLDEKILDTEEMSLVPKEICRKADTLGYAEDKFCAIFNGLGEESFAGDSGSPFLVTFKGRKHLLGVYTWGDRETRAGDYDFFTSIHTHYDWIKDVID